MVSRERSRLPAEGRQRVAKRSSVRQRRQWYSPLSAAADRESVHSALTRMANCPPSKGPDMTEAPPTNGELVRALIRAVDNSNHSAIAALTAKDVHFRFGNAAATSTQ